MNFNPATEILITFDAGRGGRPESFASRTDGFGRFTSTITPKARPAGTFQVRADDLKQREATAELVTCPPPPPPPPTPPTPAVQLQPPVGPPGFVTLAIGTGFPPGTPVTLDWSPGINARSSLTVIPDGAGGFRLPVLVFHRDLLGPRKLRASFAGGGPSSEAEAEFLVVAGRAQPPDFVVRR